MWIWRASRTRCSSLFIGPKLTSGKGETSRWRSRRPVKQSPELRATRTKVDFTKGIGDGNDEADGCSPRSSPAGPPCGFFAGSDGHQHDPHAVDGCGAEGQ